MAAKLLIGVTGPAHVRPWSWWAIRWRLRRLRVDARYLTPSSGYPEAEYDGFIISGGNDIDPAIYGGDISASPSVDPLRDEYELKILEEADRRELPVLGICRGMQLLNVHASGTLISDLKPYRKLTSNKATLLPRKKVRIADGTILHRWLGRSTVKVNSLHHQAVDQPGTGIGITSYDNDGIVQSIESTVAGPIRIGVQWHPEYMPQMAVQRALFERFTDACRALRGEPAEDSSIAPQPALTDGGNQ